VPGAAIRSLVTTHFPREGLGRLTAVRIDNFLEKAGSPQLARLLGIPDVGLVDVVPGGHTASTGRGCLEQVRDIAPATLRGHTSELEVLKDFCADDGYLRVSGPPWSGKTALLSTFVLSPPQRVDVLSFFVSARLAGFTDSEAFTDTLLDQLAALTGKSLSPLGSAAVRDARRRALLTAAAKQARQTGRRVVLVVDGLDEDRGAAPGRGLPSIASLLPKVAPKGLQMVVSNRWDAPLPADVPWDHPLRDCRTLNLVGSHGMPHLGDLARRDLLDVLAGSQLQRDVVGLLCAHAGPVSLSHLEALTDHPRFVLVNLMEGALGRIVSSTSEGPAVEYRFAHEELRKQALSLLGERMVARYREQLQ
jgi:hypothetical protein